MSDGAGTVRPIFKGDFGPWNVVVREQLIEGGKLGKDVGKIWEDYFAKTFENTGWSVVGTGIRIRDNGKIITDIDMLLLHDDLLLITQIKALIGSALTAYDHWKGRKIVEWGCIQAQRAANYVIENTEFLISVIGKNATNRIKFIKPVVLTNLDHLDGWVYRDVVVMGEIGRRSITQGSKVDYFQPGASEAVHSRHFVRRDELCTETILSLLGDPVEMRICPESMDVMHVAMEIGGIRWMRPEFSLKAQGDEFGSHESRG